MPGLVPGIHVVAPFSEGGETAPWMAGTSPAMTVGGSSLVGTMTCSNRNHANVVSIALVRHGGGRVLVDQLA